MPQERNQFLSYPISYNGEVAEENPGVAKANKAIDDLRNFNPAMFMDFVSYFINMLGREFTKRVHHHYEYFISALFSSMTI